MDNVLRQGHRLLALRQPLLRSAQGPQHPGGMAAADHASVLPIEERLGAVLLVIVKRYPLGKMGVRQGCRAQEEQRRPTSPMRRHKEGSVLDVLREGQELLAQGVRRLVLGTYVIIIPEPTQYWKKLLRLFEVFTELSSVRVRLANFGCGIAFHGNERRA